MVDYTLVYIGPIGFSGSTLLDVALAQGDDVFSMGEVFQIAEWMRENHLCTCRKPIGECAFWPGVLKDITPNALATPAGIGREDLRARTISTDEETSRYVAAHWDLIDRVAEASGARLIIDGSKHLWRLKLLADARPDKIKFIQLCRDPLAVMQSAKIPKARLAVSSTAMTKPSSGLRTLTKWILSHRAARQFADQNRIPRLSVSYDRLTHEPEKSLSAICDWIGMSYDPAMLTLKTPDLHNIAGSRWRLTKDQSTISPASDTGRNSLISKTATALAGLSR
ncbi:Sulfotransferase family protein [Cognatiyoonia koreensis]|uniref:Sulfotransferase family protein n=1 Tax=Cognatiyoonia koreensis TaxID=364200 RepID=A0A1I0RLR4_9RHOB|nr:sulfotransferase [Cognatiyoonia koreensis]SEW42057.1 Sulfotransferase family protein [Cognatiyoonia koreensis]